MVKNGTQNRIAEAVMYDWTTGGCEETTLDDINRDLDTVFSMAGYGAAEARKSEGWGVANLFDLLASHVRNTQTKVSGFLDWQNEQRAKTARESQAQTPVAVE